MSEPVPVTFGEHLLLERLGAGGMAVTWKAVEKVGSTGERVVALKQILPERAENWGFRTMFLDEVRISSLINHRNVCRVFRAGEVDGTLFMTMEFVDGWSLYALEQRFALHAAPFPIDAALFLMVEALSGLEAAHALVGLDGQPLGCVHRDVSPQNLLIGRNGDIKVIDFGIAKAAGNQARTSTGQMKGKVLYLSPEQLEGLPLDARSDIFAAGLVIYELLTGMHPLRGDSEFSTIFNYATRRIDPPSTSPPDLPSELEGVVMQALHWDPATRWASARDLGDALLAALRRLSPHYHARDFEAFTRALEAARDGVPSEIAFSSTEPGTLAAVVTGPLPRPEDAATGESMARLQTAERGRATSEPPSEEPVVDAAEGAEDRPDTRPGERGTPTDLGQPARLGPDPGLGPVPTTPRGRGVRVAGGVLLAGVVLVLVGLGLIVWQLQGSGQRSPRGESAAPPAPSAPPTQPVSTVDAAEPATAADDALAPDQSVQAERFRRAVVEAVTAHAPTASAPDAGPPTAPAEPSRPSIPFDPAAFPKILRPSTVTQPFAYDERERQALLADMVPVQPEDPVLAERDLQLSYLAYAKCLTFLESDLRQARQSYRANIEPRLETCDTGLDRAVIMVPNRNEGCETVLRISRSDALALRNHIEGFLDRYDFARIACESDYDYYRNRRFEADACAAGRERLRPCTGALDKAADDGATLRIAIEASRAQADPRLLALLEAQHGRNYEWRLRGLSLNIQSFMRSVPGWAAPGPWTPSATFAADSQAVIDAIDALSTYADTHPDELGRFSTQTMETLRGFALVVGDLRKEAGDAGELSAKSLNLLRLSYRSSVCAPLWSEAFAVPASLAPPP